MKSTLAFPKLSVRKHVLWLPVERQGTVNPASLSVELENFAEYVRLDDMEVVARRSLLIDFHESLQADERFESSQVYQYGSFPAGLSTFMSDVDVSVNHVFDSNDGSNAHFMESSNARKRPALFVDDTCCDLKRARTDANGSNSPLSDVAALRQRVADKLASKNVASEVILDDDTPVSWTIETTRTTSWRDERDMKKDSPEDFISSDDHNSSEEGNTTLRQINSSFTPARIRRKDKLFVLQKLHCSLQSAEWIEQIQFRKHARVPILNLTHKNGVECDVSLDMSQQATSLVVRSLLQRCGPALAKLSAFLKIYLNQLGLDAPFTGGLGSFKLYVLLAEHIARQPQDTELGPLLMGFLKFYGDSRNLNYSTVIEVDGAEDLHFRHVSKLADICEAFAMAHTVLLKLQLQRKFLKRETSTEGVANGEMGNLPSSSLLAALLNTEMLSVQRMQRRARCHRYLHRNTTEYSWGDGEAVSDDVGEDGAVVISNDNCIFVDGDSDAVACESGKDWSDREEEDDRGIPGAEEVDKNAVQGERKVNVEEKKERQHEDNSDSDLKSEASEASEASLDSEVDDFLSAITMPPSAGSLYHQLRADMPLLALQECMSSKANRSRKRIFNANSKEGKAIIEGTMELPRGMCVQPKQMHLLPRRYVIALGPFRMLCVAECYLRKTFAELMEQEDLQKAAIKHIQGLLKAKYFETCSAEDKLFLRQVYITNLIVPHKEFRRLFNKFERRVHNESKCSLRTIQLFLTQRAVAVGAPLKELYPTVQLEFLQSEAAVAKEFNPRKDVGKAIVAGLLDLPPKMLVHKKDVTQLPQHYQKQLWPFRSLDESNHYKNMSFAVLSQQRDTMQNKKDHLQWFYNTHGWTLLGSLNLAQDKKTLKSLIADGMVDPPNSYKLSKAVKKARTAALDYQKDWNKYYLARVKSETKRRQALDNQQQQSLQQSNTSRSRPLLPLVSSVLHAIERAIPVLVIQNCTSTDDLRLFSPSNDIGRAIIRGERLMSPGMTVLPEHVSTLPEILATALGPFRMLCVAGVYVGKAYEELVQQEEAQEESVRQLRDLYDAGHFTQCPKEDLMLLRKVCVAGLLRFENSALLQLTELEKMLLTRTAAHIGIVSRYLADRAWCMGVAPRIPFKPLVLQSVGLPIDWQRLAPSSVASQGANIRSNVVATPTPYKNALLGHISPAAVPAMHPPRPPSLAPEPTLFARPPPMPPSVLPQSVNTI